MTPFLITLAVLIVLAVLPLLFVLLVNHVLFGKRCEKNTLYPHLTLEDFDGLEAEPVVFPSNRGNNLRGYFYTQKAVVPYRAVVVFAHGFGSGQLSYIKEIDALTRAGFRVLGFDRTGTWTSGGRKLGGFYQGVLDLRAALRFLQKEPTYFADPVFLVGHSWGGNIVCQVLASSPTVKGVVSFSGFDQEEELVTDHIRKMFHFPTGFLKPYFRLVRRIHYGRQALRPCSDILRETTVPTLLFHGEDDPIIPVEYSIVHPLTKEPLPDSSPVKTVLLPGKKHQVFRTIAAETELDEFFKRLKNVEKNPQYTELKKDFGKWVNLEKLNEEDPEVIQQTVDFLKAQLEP